MRWTIACFVGVLYGGLLWGQDDSLRVISALRKDVRKLSALRGRGHGTPYAARAVRYIARRFQEMGYAVRVDTFPLSVYRLMNARLWISSDGRRWRELQIDRDFIPIGSAPSLRGKWCVDTTLTRRDCAGFTKEGLSKPLPFALRQKLPLLLVSQRKLIATTATEPAAMAVLYLRDSLGLPAFVRVRIQGKQLYTAGWNVSARLPGQRSDSAWVVGAHYDHLGYIGRAIFHGANDNASGVAMLLLLAEKMKRFPALPPYDIWFVAFGAEELGLIGSQHWVRQPPYPLERLRGMLNFDLMGFGEKGVAVVGAADQPAFWQRIDSVRSSPGWNPPLLLRPNAPNSDHYPFREKGVPALFFYLEGGPGFYHDTYDKAETLSWAAAVPFLRWMEAVLRLP